MGSLIFVSIKQLFLLFYSSLVGKTYSIFITVDFMSPICSRVKTLRTFWHTYNSLQLSASSKEPFYISFISLLFIIQQNVSSSIKFIISFFSIWSCYRHSPKKEKQRLTHPFCSSASSFLRLYFLFLSSTRS